jgi:predicted AlkP superfamily phosphohydrolase/phosphomutase
MQRVFIIGWDGATFDLIRPWVAEGKLPNVAKLMETGTHGPLRSTLPPWTFPAWNSFMTGKNPGKHGIFDFLRMRPGTYDLEFVNGGHRRAATFWQLLSTAGRSVVSISVPCTFPPERVNGVMISGFDVPGGGGPGSAVDARGIYPREFYDELTKNVGGHPVGAAGVKDINAGRPDLAVELILTAIERKAATAKYLITHRPWDCFMILFGESDGSGHQFWKYCDPHSPLFTEQPAGMRDSILRVYQALDRQIGEMRALLPPDTNVLMMSDHGFGGVSDWVIYPNCWLHEKGLLRMRGRLRNRLSRSLDDFKFWVLSTLPPKVKRFLFRLGGRNVGRFESSVRYGMIDWTQTQVYFDENPYYPSLRVNLKGRQPRGTVEPGQPYEDLRSRVIQELESWRHPQTGDPIVEKAYRREEVYSGPCLDEAPDIVVKWALHQGYSYAFKISSKSRSRAWIERVDPHHPENLQYFSSKSGTHRDYGIFLAQGPAISTGATPQSAQMTDLAPTILHLLNVPVPEDMDGRVLEEILTNAFRTPVQRTSGTGTVVPAAAEHRDGYSAEDEEKVNERLKALGYVE